MRRQTTKYLECCRVTTGVMASGPEFGLTGMFVVEFLGAKLAIMASDGDMWPLDGTAWEHVSVSTETRCPTWGEMVYVKGLFWRPEEVVMQLHVAESDHVNVHPLHLWKPVGKVIPLPPRETLA